MLANGMSRVTLLNKLFSGHKMKHHQLVSEFKIHLQLKHSLSPQQQNKWLIPNAAATIAMVTSPLLSCCSSIENNRLPFILYCAHFHLMVCSTELTSSDKQAIKLKTFY